MDRRDILMAGAAAAVTPSSGTLADPGAGLLIGGNLHPVTKRFQSEVLSPHPDLAGMAYEDLCRKRDALLGLSDLRNRYAVPIPPGPMAPGGTLTVRENERLQAITHVINVHNAVNFLQGRPISDFGFAGVDQVHGNSCSKPCGCIDTYVFDHHKRHEADIKTHPHYPKYVCAEHAPRV